MPRKSKSSPRQIGTWATNKFAHPGKIVKPSAPCRTLAEVNQDHEAKAQAKADHEAAKKKSIAHAAQFEQSYMADEDMADATPRPHFTPKPPPCNKRKSKL